MAERARLIEVNQDMRCDLIFYKGVGMNKKLVFKMHFELVLKTFSLCDRVEQERARLLEVGQPYMRWD